MSSPPSNVALVDRLFSRLTLIFGAQKVGSMWDGIEDRSEVTRLWAAQLSRFQPASIGAALQGVIDSGREWPPTLPEFVEACRLAAVGRQNAAALTYTPTPVSPEVVKENLTQVEEMAGRVGEAGRNDPLHWAKHPRSVHALRLLVRGAKADQKLRDVLRGHVEDAGARLPAGDALRYFTAALERDRSLLTNEVGA